MTYLDLTTHRLHYRIDGSDSEEPWLMFCNSLGTDLHMWDAQVAELSNAYRILRYDRRGHGLSSPPPPPYALSDLGNDVIALLDVLDISKTHFCGLSIGGLTGQWLGIHASERFDKIIVCATAAKIGTAEGWASRIEAVQQGGLEPLRAATVERWFSPAFHAAEPETVDSVLESFVATSLDGYTGCCAALADADLRADISRIDNPLLAISGADDAVCPPTDLELIAATVKNGKHISLPGRHIVSIESAAGFNRVLADFIEA
ncbi:MULTISPECIES: 3-oxoadipate enol-lactonase [Agrobacterium tumefaciens complex]|jgi:3-oxoadipate enol-lactonase|uniref:3-oxoadipate enol-lactonase n=1 Tax=Agrobacterium tumefaciens TaxID=358 RepID=UPI000FE29A66|nr:3-oxoadipate enol-lactonase [Agrobacterium tumefaciens]QAA98383.1 3-oxoadipate enol-lactonase [Agrobacterium tumefaciens]QAB01092.1 3-oxoadipate enol-lactonase [Agrobacterium tumefaciens]